MVSRCTRPCGVRLMIVGSEDDDTELLGYAEDLGVEDAAAGDEAVAVRIDDEEEPPPPEPTVRSN